MHENFKNCMLKFQHINSVYMQILIGSTGMLIGSLLNMRFSKVSMQVQRWTCVDVLFELVQMRILALYVTKTLNFFVVTSLLQNVAIRTDITCRFLAFILWKMQKIRKFCMLPVQILYSMFEPLLAWLYIRVRCQ